MLPAGGRFAGNAERCNGLWFEAVRLDVTDQMVRSPISPRPAAGNVEQGELLARPDFEERLGLA